MKTSDIRKCFLEYFKNRDHKIAQSSSLIPYNDDSLMFTNSGMVQFKNVFLGSEKLAYSKASTAQKCVRAGGKHNDLDNVGYTARHHTFFEMLGNFSFGDYFKEEAITYAWNFLTKVVSIPKEKLCVTVFYQDEEAKNIWAKIAPQTTVIPITTNDNFWSMGESGPCGPCSEIFYDHGAHIKGGMPGSLEQDGDRFVEIWNIVFMEFFQNHNSPKIPLEKKSIDTGMGLERLAAVLQGVTDNYDIDIIKNLINATEDVLSVKCNSENKSSFKVIADHIRSVAFMIADGVMPSNDGRGYVLRRILRRAVRHYHLLGYKDTCLHKLIPFVIEDMKWQYPELQTHCDNILCTTKAEEEKFLSTIDRGIKLLQDEVYKLRADTFPGDIAFKLYDTYGFPLDLTEDILASNNIKVDIDMFNQKLDEQKNRGGYNNVNSFYSHDLFCKIKEKTSKFLPNGSEFVGYDTCKLNARVYAIIKDNQLIDEITYKQSCEQIVLIVDKSCFYPESGGQLGDIGYIENTINSLVIKVTNCQKFCDNLIGITGVLTSGTLSVNSLISMRINEDNRKKASANHTATHLLQAALKQVINPNISQRGSMVSADLLRFDFNHSAPLTNDELQKIEKLMNTWIVSVLDVKTAIISKQQALSEGAVALFGEKYAENVRVVEIGDNCSGNLSGGSCVNGNNLNGFDEIVSKELCGGTHVANTGQIGAFKIISECSIGSGLRRIEAVTMENCNLLFDKMFTIVKNLTQVLNIQEGKLLEKIDEIVEENKSLTKEIVKIHGDEVLKNNLIEKKIAGINVKFLQCNACAQLQIKEIADKLRKNKLNTIVVICNSFVDNISVVIAVTEDVGCKASEILSYVMGKIGGKGGGRADFAQGGVKFIGVGEDPLRSGDCEIIDISVLERFVVEFLVGR